METMSTNPIDIALVLLVGLSTLGGLMHGFSRLVVGTLAALTGIFLGFWFYGVVAGPLVPYVSRKEIAYAIGFIIILGACVLIGAVAGRILASVFKWVGLSWMDRLLGGAAGFVRGAIIAVALMTVVLACAPAPPPQVILEAKLMPYVMQASRVLVAATPSELKQAFEETQHRVREIWEQHTSPLDRHLENKA